MVVDALHGKEHSLLLAGGQDLAQTAQERFLRLLPGHTGLFGHVGGLAAHAACTQRPGNGDLAQHLCHLGTALVLVGITQLHIGAVHGNAHAGRCRSRPCTLHQRRGHIGIALYALHRLGKGQLECRQSLPARWRKRGSLGHGGQNRGHAHQE